MRASELKAWQPLFSFEPMRMIVSAAMAACSGIPPAKQKMSPSKYSSFTTEISAALR